MLLSPNFETRPTPRAHRRFRIFVGCLALLVVVFLVLQYTPYRVFPERKTSTFWGFLVGLALMTGYAEYSWRERD
jgi:hypothetical protein